MGGVGVRVNGWGGGEGEWGGVGVRVNGVGWG